MNQDPESQAIELIPPSSLEAIERGTVDVQIATAHRYPRSMTTFKQRALSMATLDEETAQSCIYNRPVGGGKFAEGLSVRMAEIVGASYGNLRVGAMIIEMGERRVVARGFAHDLETNFASTSEVVEATIKRDGTPYDERMRAVIAKAAMSKARRDATFQVVPKALCRPIEQAVKALLQGDGSAQTIAKRRANVLVWLKSLGIDLGRIWAALQIKGEDDIGTEQLQLLAGIRTTIKDGETTVDEAFPPIIAGGKIGSNPLTEGGNAPAATTRPRATKGAKTEEPAAQPQGPATPTTEASPTTAADPAPAAPVAPAPTATIEELRAQLEAKCKAENIDPSDLVLYLAKQSFVPKGTTVNGMAIPHINAVFANWADVVAGVAGA